MTAGNLCKFPVIFFGHLFGISLVFRGLLGSCFNKGRPLVIFLPGVQKGKGGISGFPSMGFNKIVKFNLLRSEPGLLLALGHGLGFFLAPAGGQIIGAGEFLELILIGLVTAKKQGDAVMNLGNHQGNTSGLDTNGALAADPVSNDDTIPVILIGNLVNGLLELFFQ